MAELIDIYLAVPWDNQDEWGLLCPHPSLCHGSPSSLWGLHKAAKSSATTERQGAAMLLRGKDPFWELQEDDKKGEEYFTSELPRTQTCVTDTLCALASGAWEACSSGC